MRETEHLLREFAPFEALWAEFIGTLGTVVAERGNANEEFWHPLGREALRRVEALRIDLASRQQDLLPAYRDPLAKFLRTSVLAYTPDLWELLGRFIYDGGQVLLPMGYDQQAKYEVDQNRFEISVGEARVEIARRRRELETQLRQQNVLLEETQRAADEAHARALELQRAQGGGFWKPLWSKLRRLFWWFAEEPVRRNLLWLIALIILFAVVPPHGNGLRLAGHGLDSVRIQ